VGPNSLAVLLVVDYWALYLASRRLTPEDVTRRSIFARFVSTGKRGVSLSPGPSKAD